jgi:hypothetical protein
MISNYAKDIQTDHDTSGTSPAYPAQVLFKLVLPEISEYMMTIPCHCGCTDYCQVEHKKPLPVDYETPHIEHYTS